MELEKAGVTSGPEIDAIEREGEALLRKLKALSKEELAAFQKEVEKGTSGAVKAKFDEASHKAMMQESPRVIASFESSYYAAIAEMGCCKVTKDNLVYNQPESSKWFQYEFVTDANGNIIGNKATAKSDIGEFAKGSFIQTTYQKSEDKFTHCAGGKNGFNAAKKWIPNFMENGVVCP